MPEAARLHDPISHAPTLGLLVAGAVIGGALTALAVVTAPVSVPVLIGGAMIAGATVAGAGIGEFIGSLSFARSIEGRIARPGSANVFINNRPAARAHLDLVDCRQHAAGPMVAQGSDSVFINGQPAARKGDRTACDAVIDAGSPDVLIGGGTATTDSISPEVPDLVHKAMLVVGLGSAMVLFGPEMAILGLAGGLLGGEVMNAVGGAVFGEGSDGQKILAFGGSIAGGLGAAKGTAWFNRNYQIRQTGLGMNGGGISITRMTGETPSTAVGKSVHAEQAISRRASEDFDLVNAPVRDAAGTPIRVARRVDYETGLPADGRTQIARPDAVDFKRRLILDDKPIGRPIAKDRQEIIRFIDAYKQSQGHLPRTIAIQRYDPVTGQPVFTELFSPPDFLP